MEDQSAKHGKLWHWLDERIGLGDIEYLAKKKEVPVHGHTFWYYFGGMTLFLFMIQVTTGILLLLYYRPSAGEALVQASARSAQNLRRCGTGRSGGECRVSPSGSSPTA